MWTRLLLAARFVLPGLLLLGLVTACPSRSRFVFSVDYGHPSLGIGPHLYSGAVVLDPGSEERAMTQALVAALQGLELNLTPPLEPAQWIARNREFETDIAPLPPRIIDEYNAASGSGALTLPGGAIYGLRYKGSYDIRDSQFKFSVSSILYYRSWGGREFRPYPQDYSSRFFGTLLQTQIVGALKAGASPHGAP